MFPNCSICTIHVLYPERSDSFLPYSIGPAGLACAALCNLCSACDITDTGQGQKVVDRGRNLNIHSVLEREAFLKPYAEISGPFKFETAKRSHDLAGRIECLLLKGSTPALLQPTLLTSMDKGAH